MKDKIFNILSYFLPVAAGMIFILFVIAFVSSLIPAFSLQWDFSNEGFKGFFETYSSSLQLGAALFGIMALMLTLERMKQTQKQIEVMSDNNRFNNFYKHRDMFIQELSTDKFMVNLASYSKLDLKELLSKYHGRYYTKQYQNFSPKINEREREHMFYYFHKANFSTELNQNFDKTIVSEKLGIIWFDHGAEIDKAIDGLRKDFLTDKFLRGKQSAYGNNYKLLKIFYTCHIMRTILNLAGESESQMYYPSAFTLNFVNYLKSMNMMKLSLT